MEAETIKCNLCGADDPQELYRRSDYRFETDEPNFRSFGEALENRGFVVFWVHITRDAARLNRMYLPTADRLTPDDLRSLQEAYDRLYASLVTPNARVMREHPPTRDLVRADQSPYV